MKSGGKLKRARVRVNRGIVLGLALGIILVTFVAFDTIKFNKDTEKVRQDIVNYITDMAQLNGSLESTDVGRVVTESDRELMSSGLEEILDRYYADPALAEAITVYDGYDRDEISRELYRWFYTTAGFELASAQADGESNTFRISFERQGYRYARVNLNDLPVLMDITEIRRGETDIFLGGGPSYLIDQKYSEEDEAWGRQNERTIYVSGTMYITLVDDQWKILMSELYTKKAPEID